MNLGTTSCLLFLLVSDSEGEFFLLWYEEPMEIAATFGEGSAEDGTAIAHTNITGDTAFRFAPAEILAEGYGRYLDVLAEHPGAYLGSTWLAETN